MLPMGNSQWPESGHNWTVNKAFGEIKSKYRNVGGSGKSFHPANVSIFER